MDRDASAPTRVRGSRTEPTGVQVGLLGPLTLGLPDSGQLGPRDFSGRKPKQLLEVLLLARGHRVRKDELAELLWGSRPPSNVSGTLETYVSVLRRALGTARSLVVTEPGAYRVDLRDTVLDLDRFDDLTGQAASSPSPYPILQEALGLVRGDLLEDEPDAPWAVEPRQYYRAAVQEARLETSALALWSDGPATALDLAHAALSHGPLDERAHRAVIVAQYLAGARQQALDTYAACRRTLRGELGLDPAAETQALQRAVLLGEPQHEVRERFVRRRMRRGSAPPSPPPAGRPMHILLVEDDPADARIIAEALASGTSHPRLHRTTDGEAALAFLRRHPPFEDAPRPDLVLLDLHLPGMDGHEVLTRIKTDERVRSLPVVVLSTSDVARDISGAYERHANGYVKKPANIEEFAAVVRAIEAFWPVTAPPPVDVSGPPPHPA
jgi:two-component system, chemotaxis family, response regulator Rcp1